MLSWVVNIWNWLTPSDSASWNIPRFKEGSDAFMENDSLTGYEVKVGFVPGKLQTADRAL